MKPLASELIRRSSRLLATACQHGSHFGPHAACSRSKSSRGAPSAFSSASKTLLAGAVPWLIAAFAAAYVLGYLSMLTPSGLGVREGVLVLLLEPLFPEPLPVVIALAARIWMTLGELGAAGVAALTLRRTRTSPPTEPPA